MLTLTAQRGRQNRRCLCNRQEQDLMLPYSPTPIFKRPKMAFKGHIPTLRFVTSMWRKGRQALLRIGAHMHSIGGEVIRTKDSVTISVYRRRPPLQWAATSPSAPTGTESFRRTLYARKRMIYVPWRTPRSFRHGMAARRKEQNSKFDYPSEKTHADPPKE